MKQALRLITLAMLLAGCASRIAPLNTAASFNLTPPPHQPAAFNPLGIWIDAQKIESISFSANGRRLCYASHTEGDSTRRIYTSRFQDGKWQTPIALPSQPAKKHQTFPTFAMDGRDDIYFTQGPPTTHKMARYHNNTWQIEDLPNPPNASIEWGITHTTTGLACFGGPTEDSQADLFIARRTADGYSPATRLPEPINSTANDTRPYISPDGDFMIFESTRQGGNPDLYVSFSMDNGKGMKWTAPLSLGTTINTASLEDGPWVSPDGKHLFFRRWTDTGYGTGVSQIYWVDIAVVHALDPRPLDT